MRYIAVLASLFVLIATPFAYSQKTASGDVAANASEVHIVFVGDIMVGRYVGTMLQARGYDAPFGDVKAYLQEADLTVGNLEGPVVPPGTRGVPAPSPNELNLTGSSRVVPVLQQTGFDLLSVSNNHSLDAGPTGLNSTLAALRASGIGALGATDKNGSQSPVVREVRGLKIAFLAYTSIRPNRLGEAAMHNPASPVGIAYVNPGNTVDKDRFAREITAAKSQAAVVVVVMHWGTEYASQPDAGQKELSILASSAGADLVVGMHPHVAQGLQVEPQGTSKRPSVVAYSLGNALFDQVANAQTRQGLALDCRISSAGVRSARLVPLEIQAGGSYKMRVADDASGQPTITRAALSTPANLQWRALWDAAQAASGLGIAYQQDASLSDRESAENLGLQGATQVQLHNGTLSVKELQAGGGWRIAWSSDPGWRVTSYTVGDANADGKPDLIYSLWKRRLTWERPPEGGLQVNMQGGEVSPHIYVNSWRDGELRPLWHGSPRPAPSLALAVPRIGSNGTPLLAVLESSNAAKEQAPGTLKLWKWTGGFGYELARPVPGAYFQMWADERILLFR